MILLRSHFHTRDINVGVQRLLKHSLVLKNNVLMDGAKQGAERLQILFTCLIHYFVS